jgi:hypothetical protein
MTAVDYAFAWGVTVGVAAGALITAAVLSLKRRWRRW